MKASQSFTKDVDGVSMSLTIIPYTNSCVIAVGPRGLLGFMHESVCTNLAVSPITHRILLGARDDLVTPIFCQQLGDKLIRTLRMERIVMNCSVGKDLLMAATTVRQITSWVVDSVEATLKN